MYLILFIMMTLLLLPMTDGRKDLYGTGDNSVLKIASAEYEEPKGTAPVIEGVENGGNYYATQKITVRDADNDLASVTVNGETRSRNGNFSFRR